VQLVQDLVTRALAAPLLPAQQQCVLTALEQDPKLVYTLQLAPQQVTVAAAAGACTSRGH